MQKSQGFVKTDTNLTSGDVMSHLRISRRTLERYVADGTLAALYLPTRHRRYSLAAVNALLSPTAPAAAVADPDIADPDIADPVLAERTSAAPSPTSPSSRSAIPASLAPTK